MNTHVALCSSYMFREGIYKGIQVQQILSKMCICRVYLHDDDLVAVKTCRRNMRDKLLFITDCAAYLI